MQNRLTPQAAIIELSHCKINGYSTNDWDRRCNAVELAKSALEKRIPCKPKKISPRNPNGSITTGYVCGKCGEEVMELFEQFCPGCGQMIDWG